METKAIRVHATGGPEVMTLEAITLPEPGPGEALVRIHAIGVNYIDTYFRAGAYKAPSLPFIPGNEAAGEVVAVGAGVSSVKAGDRVAFVAALGCYAGARIVPAERLIALPDAVGYEQAAAMMLKGLTAQYLLRQTYRVQAGDTILVHAAAGGVGLILCQWAKLLGATVIGTVGSAEKRDLAQRAGADHLIFYRDEDFAARVREITGGKGCAVVYDGVGKTTFPGSLDCLAPLGMFVSFGSSSGKIDSFDLNVLSAKGSLFVTRPTLNTYTADPQTYAAMAQELGGLVGDGKIAITVSATAPLEEAVVVHRSLEARQTTGSVVLTA